MTKTYRPGVYSQYDIISQRRSLQDRYAFYCGAAKVREGKSIPAGGVVQIHSRQELEEYFDAQGGALFCAVCGILLDSGVSGVYAVPLTIDGTAAAENLYEPAIQKLCEVKRSGVILCDSQAQTVLQKLVEQVQLASQNERERLAVGGVAKAQAQQIAKALNCERLVLCCQAGSDGETESSVILTAAALAAMLVGSEPMDNLHGKVLESLTEIDPLEEQEVESLLGSGVTVLESLDGAVSCIRCVTSRTLTGGEEDRTFASVNTVMMIDDIIRSVRERLSDLLRGSTILFSQDSVASQAAVVLDQKQQEGMVTSFEPSRFKKEEGKRMALLSIPTSADISIEVNGQKVAAAQSYRVQSARESRYIEAFGSREPVGTVGGRVQHKIELTRVCLCQTEGIDFYNLSGFNLVIVQPDCKIIYSGCEWADITQSAAVGETILEKVSVVASRRIKI